jgi:hypothetical protein
LRRVQAAPLLKPILASGIVDWDSVTALHSLANRNSPAWQVNSNNPHDIGFYVAPIRDALGELVRLELRSVFRPNTAIATLYRPARIPELCTSGRNRREVYLGEGSYQGRSVGGWQMDYYW